MRSRTHMHGKKSTQRSPGVRSFHQGGRGEGWRVRPSEAQAVGTRWGGVGGGGAWRQEPPASSCLAGGQS